MSARSHADGVAIASTGRTARATPSAPGARSATPWFRVLLGALYVVSFLAIVFLLWRGASFYATPLRERAHHEGYWTWKAGGSIGQRMGVVGASMMGLLLLYSVRKRVGLLRRVGPLSRWLDLHIYLGVVGPLLIILHTAFKVGGLVALSFWSMVAVALSGVLGRYLYLQIPRTKAGEELTLAELQGQDKALTARLRDEFGLGDAQLKHLQALAAPPTTRGLVATVARLVIDDLRLRSRLRTFATEHRTNRNPVFRDFQEVVRQKALAERRLLIWDRVHEAFHYWHVVHKPFAVVMYLFMLVHIAVAVMTGYGGIFG